MRRALASVVLFASLTGCNASGGGTGGTGGDDGATSGSPQGSGTSTSGVTSGTASGMSTTGSASTGASGDSLSAMYPGDIGMENDPSIVWFENFEESSVSDFQARYDQVQGAAYQAFIGDVPSGSSGASAIRLTAGGNTNDACDFYKLFDENHDELFVRYYVRYAAGGVWHHSGVWFGGYDPPTPYPNPVAGYKPNGDDRFAIAFEPIESGPNVRLDFYDYWMKMHSWMDVPQGSTAYYGNSLVHLQSLRAPDDTWLCVELHARVNPDPSSPAGAMLGLWINDAPIVQFDDQGPVGWWGKDKFCTMAADAPECTDYTPASPDWVPLDNQFRSTSALALNYLWPANYITDGPEANVDYDDMVVATRRIGCVVPAP